ncbi:hypothetical protein PSHT_03156 [Puccinia striiformis]|uniref:Uncharacterized protein n=1 Tax=Puccinia striiformis TaxID=27350 RepID=A0A2S4WG45_9BASI|nr:hypothetical protein PSHT_03156 [Puccinia striiformis]
MIRSHINHLISSDSKIGFGGVFRALKFSCQVIRQSVWGLGNLLHADHNWSRTIPASRSTHRHAMRSNLGAYESLSADSQGNLSAKNNLAAPSVSASYRSCRVIIVTTDGSKIRMKKAAAEPFFKRMVQACDGKWAYMSMVGAEGPNGRTIMHTFSEVQTS